MLNRVLYNIILLFSKRKKREKEREGEREEKERKKERKERKKGETLFIHQIFTKYVLILKLCSMYLEQII